MHIPARLNTYYRLLVLILGTSTLFFILYASLYFYTFKQEKAVYKSALTEYTNEVNSIFRLNSKTHIASIVDVTFWDEMVDFIHTRDTSWYKDYIDTEFFTYEVDYIGIYNLNKRCLAKSTSNEFHSNDFIPSSLFDELYKSRLTRFYLKLPEGVVEVFGATVHPSDDPKKNKYPPSGFFIMARLLDKSFIKDLEAISSSHITLASDNYIVDKDPNQIKISLDLKDWKSHTIARLHFDRPFNLNFSNTKKILDIIIIATLANLLVFLYYYRKWVYRPVKLITTILEKKDENSIQQLKLSRDEFGHIGRLFEENHNQRQQLVIAKERAEESDKLKSSFLANLSHEIRTPMNAIMGFSNLLKNEGTLDEEERAKYLRIISHSGKNLIGIIEDLIEMSKIDSRQISPNYSGINLDQCLSDLYQTIHITIPKDRAVKLTIDQPESPLLKRNILTDPIKLKQILTNLITNAIKFTEKGEVKVGYCIRQEEQLIEIAVEDSGLGIDEENQKIIFDRFRKIENDSTINLSGLGLGLSITKAYVELLGGTIWVKSSIGSGSVFSFTIPLKYDEETQNSPILQHKIQYNGNRSEQTILIAEDNDINFLLLEKILTLRSYSVIRAVNGKEAIEICWQNNSISLIFMDIKMPVMDGFEAFSSIQKIKPELPVIANTAYAFPEDKTRIINAGFHGYITKPLNKDEIYVLLDEILGTNSL